MKHFHFLLSFLMLQSSFSVLGSNRGFSQKRDQILDCVTVENLAKKSPEAVERQLNSLFEQLKRAAATEHLQDEVEVLRAQVEVKKEELQEAVKELRRERDNAAWKKSKALRDQRDALAESDGILRKQIDFLSKKLTRLMTRVSFTLLKSELFSSQLSQEMKDTVNGLHGKGGIYTEKGDLATNSALLLACLKALAKVDGGVPKNLSDKRFKAFGDFLVALVKEGYSLNEVKGTFAFLGKSYLDDLKSQAAQSR